MSDLDLTLIKARNDDGGTEIVHLPVQKARM